MQLHVFNTREEMGNAAGKAVEERILTVLEKKDYLRMVFAAAPSQNEFLKYLRNSKLIPWEKVVAFHMDEYLGLLPEDQALFSNFLKRNLFDHCNFKDVFIIEGNKNTEDEIARYTRLINESPIDIVCLGIGENGHIAFNDPPVADFNDPNTIKIVELDLACRQQQVNDACFPSIEEVPTHALSLTIPALLETDYLCCVVPGPNKKQALESTLTGPIDTSCPASILKLHWQCDLFTDRAAYPENLPWKETKYDLLQDIENGSFQLNNDKGRFTPVRFYPPDQIKEKIPFFGPGLIDLQVNGVNGVDFNDASLSISDIEKSVEYLLTIGVTGFLPTLITNEKGIILKILDTITQACEINPLVDSCILGVHLEGPFISNLDGARGAHNPKFIQEPSWELLQEFQKAAKGRIKLLTLAPELEGAIDLIKKCKESGIQIAIGHSYATYPKIKEAVEAGARLSTHLGNAVPLTLPRHPNILWDQLAMEGLYASLVADGFHLDDSFLKTVIKVKCEKSFLISDSTLFTGMPPGEYKAHIGDEVVLEENGRLSLKHGKGLLAGASKNLREGVEYLVKSGITDLSSAWKMATSYPVKFLALNDSNQTLKEDWVIFNFEEGKIKVMRVIKNGQVVFSSD
ncbi:6-phosphogluconolactonase [Shivajiella indica]|uniref:6-phosphogluconolactonase n=1 Tax=Shivajiella indica TaxID=872115 RepID=A0ABW5B3F2_9BACT